MHLNIRSLPNKISEVKNIVLEHKPHILGLSECELRMVQNKYDENKLKIPGYKIFFPKSWSLFGYARVVVYIKTTLSFEEIKNLEDNDVQSIWIKAGFKNIK